MLIGDAGSGKTIELERVAHYFSQENASFYSLVIHLNTFSDQNIVDMLPEDWSNIPENQWLIIMDGLDEIESKNKKDAIRKIEFFSERYPASTILISCRTNFYQTEKKPYPGTLTGFESYRLLDLEYEQIQLYVDSNLFSMANKFFDKIKRNYLVSLLNNPFYLITLVALFKDENALPEQRAMIYEKLFLARIKLDERHFRTTIDLEEQKEAIIKNLESVALGMECLGRNYLSEDEYKQLVPDLSSRELIKHCTAWKREGVEDTKWQFEHNNIQEYLAARILSSQHLSTIKTFVSFKPEYKKIIPSWVNTVSFLISISTDSNFINWILEIEPEICLKSEPDKVLKDVRIKIFKSIFNRYKEKQILIDRDRFRSDELARFGQSDEILKFLLEEAQNISHPTTLSNAIEIIREMIISPDFKDPVRKILVEAALNKFKIPVNESIQCHALIALSYLKFDTKDIVDRIVATLKDSYGDWVRYGLYYFLHESEYLDDYIDIFLDGIHSARIDYPSGGHSRLANERWELKQGLEKVKSSSAIKKIIEYFINNESELNNLFIGNHDISFMAELATKAYKQDPTLFNLVIDFSLSMIDNHHNEEAAQFLTFYEKTSTKLDAFMIGMKKESPYLGDFLADLADEKSIEFFINQYAQGNVVEDLVWKFLNALRWKNNKIFKPFYVEINQKSNDKFILKPVPDWDKIRKDRRDRDINLIFNKENLLNEIKLIFETEGKKFLTTKELFSLRTKSWPNQYYSDLACDVLREIAYGNDTITIEMVDKTFTESFWDWFRISKIYDKYRTYKELELAKPQKDWIAEWCYSHLSKVDFKTAITKSDERISIRMDAIFIWYFFRKFDLKYPKNILLDMLYFDYEDTGIEYLEKHLLEIEMTSRILKNLNEGVLLDHVLKNHIDYCKRHKMKEIIKYALKEINNQDRAYEIRRISLDAVYELSEDLSGLEKTLPEIKDDFKWQVINELMKSKSEKIKPFLKELFQKGNGEDRLKVAEYLIKCQDLDALRFYVAWIKEHKDISRQSFDSSPLRALKIHEAIPMLMELLDLTYRENLHQSDPFERLDRLVLDSLTSIALVSDDSYLKVKKNMGKYIYQYSSIYQDIHWLNAFLDQLEQKYYINKSERLEISDVLRKLNAIGF